MIYPIYFIVLCKAQLCMLQVQTWFQVYLRRVQLTSKCRFQVWFQVYHQVSKKLLKIAQNSCVEFVFFQLPEDSIGSEFWNNLNMVHPWVHLSNTMLIVHLSLLRHLLFTTYTWNLNCSFFCTLGTWFSPDFGLYWYITLLTILRRYFTSIWKSKYILSIIG